MPTVQQSDLPTLRHRSRRRRVLHIAGAVVVVAIGWYLFRPELLFISRHVNETFPATTAHVTTASQAALRPLSQGRFHGVAHATHGLATLYQFDEGRFHTPRGT
jgi:hypothetical protein